eukprot:729050-Rhodomonas_salina.1
MLTHWCSACAVLRPRVSVRGTERARGSGHRCSGKPSRVQRRSSPSTRARRARSGPPKAFALSAASSPSRSS